LELKQDVDSDEDSEYVQQLMKNPTIKTFKGGESEKHYFSMSSLEDLNSSECNDLTVLL
jgi:hypothetical protein